MKKIIRLTESQLINLIRKSINEQVDLRVQRAADDGGKCRADDARCKADKRYDRQQSKEDKLYQKEVEKQQKIDTKQSKDEFRLYLNPDYNQYNEKLDRSGRNEFNTAFSSYISSNPEVRDSDGYTAKQIYTVIRKETNHINRNTSYWLRGRLNLSGDKTNYTEKEIFDSISKEWGSFINFLNAFNPNK